MPLKTFKRYEKKFLLSEAQYAQILTKLRPFTEADRNSRDGASYTIYNIYFDTNNNDIIRHSIANPYYKEKLRLRSYTIPKTQEDEVFLEFKKKIGGIISKRRVSLPLQTACEFVATGVKPEADSYIDNMALDEIAEFLRKNSVVPKVFLAYDRKALFVKDDRSVRITFDRNIRTRRNDVALEKGDSGGLLMENNPWLMEIKFTKAIPMWLTEILSELKIYKIGFSKYGTEYQKHLAETMNGAGKSIRYAPVYTMPALILKPCTNQ